MKRKAFTNLLKHLFIPHIDNEYKPHFFREHSMLTLLIGSIFLLLLSFTSYTVLHTTKFGSKVVASVLVDLTNKTRIENNLPPLLTNQKLITAATLKGNDMVQRDYFAHYAPDGTSPWHWFKEAGYRYKYAGENLAINFASSKEVEEAWLNSPKHRENILSEQYEDIGIATIEGTPSTTPALFVVQMFGKPSQHISTTTSVSTERILTSAHLYEKILFNASQYVTNIYLTLLVVLMLSLFLMIGIEVRKQHYLHIFYGVILGVIIAMCIFVNALLV